MREQQLGLSKNATLPLSTTYFSIFEIGKPAASRSVGYSSRLPVTRGDACLDSLLYRHAGKHMNPIWCHLPSLLLVSGRFEAEPTVAACAASASGLDPVLLHLGGEGLLVA